MNNPSEASLTQGEMMVLAGLLAGSPNRQARRSSGLHGDDNKPKFRREKRDKKRREGRRARAKNRRQT